MTRLIRDAAVLAFAATLLCFSNANASILTINIGGNEISSSGASGIPSDAIVLKFDDFGGTGTVKLTVTFNGDGLLGTLIGSGARLNDLVFNVDRAITITHTSGVIAGFTSYDSDAHDLNGAHGFDVLMDFPPPDYSLPNPVNDFNEGDSSVYTLTAAGLTVSSFNVGSTGGKNGNKDPGLLAVVHINEVNVGKSGHYAGTVGTVGGSGSNDPVPEPISLVIWTLIGGTSICGLYLRRRRQ